jgi:endonuclease YncB( thermonuclease family)
MSAPFWFCLPIKAVRVVDGDTLEVTMSLREYVRLAGIDAPESGDPDERKAAEVVTLAVKQWLSRQKHVRVEPIDYDKFGQRVLGAVYGSERLHLAAWLLSKGLVRQYNGGKKEDWPTGRLAEIADRRTEFEPES